MSRPGFGRIASHCFGKARPGERNMVDKMADQPSGSENYFLNDVRNLRAAAQTQMLAGHDGAADAQTAIALLQTMLTAEIVCVLRYTEVSVSAAGLSNPNIGSEFQEQANDERRHMMMMAERIEQLGGVPDFNPTNLQSRAMIYRNLGSLDEVIKQNLVAEQNVIEQYRDLIGYFADHDPTTALVLEQILQDEEDHTMDMHDLLLTHRRQDSPYKN